MKGQIAVIFALIAFSYAIPQAEEVETPEEEVSTLNPVPETSNPSAKRRQFIAPPQVLAQAIPVAPAVVTPLGQCPGGPSLPIECDPKRPWPTCPPQSYCYAVGTVDIGPYFCCPVWSTYGAAWRPATPFYNYVPPPPANWPEALRASVNWPTSALSMPAFAVPRPLKKKTEPKFNDEPKPTEDQQKIEESMSKWLDRQSKML